MRLFAHSLSKNLQREVHVFHKVGPLRPHEWCHLSEHLTIFLMVFVFPCFHLTILDARSASQYLVFYPLTYTHFAAVIEDLTGRTRVKFLLIFPTVMTLHVPALIRHLGLYLAVQTEKLVQRHWQDLYTVSQNDVSVIGLSIHI